MGQVLGRRNLSYSDCPKSSVRTMTTAEYSCFVWQKDNIMARLWDRLPYGVRMEILQGLDIRTYRRLSRVSHAWRNDISLIYRSNKGTLFMTWKDIQWPTDDSGTSRRLQWIETHFDGLSWSELMGDSTVPVRHIICDGAFPFVYWVRLHQDGPLPELKTTFFTFPNRLIRITVINLRWDYVRELFNSDEDGRPIWPERDAKVKELLLNVTDCLVFRRMVVNPRHALRPLWYSGPRGNVPLPGVSLYRWTISREDGLFRVPFQQLCIPEVVFDMKVFQEYCNKTDGFFYCLPWMSDAIARSDILWKYPPAQSQWLQQCLNILSSHTKSKKFDDGMDYWTRDAVKTRLDGSLQWRESLRLRNNTFSKTNVHFEGYFFDTLECEVFAQWFLATRDWSFRHSYFKDDEELRIISHTPFSAVHPDYPPPPFSMVGIKPENRSEYGDDNWLNKYRWCSTVRAQANLVPFPSCTDVQILLWELKEVLRQRCNRKQIAFEIKMARLRLLLRRWRER
ncbi:hypothetical protein RvY_15244 [Ramazzottius varieornatus]|uniref:F-box domain-containing protein n=1 Tax=Ramazzottius varieornatus TaxID=947166 RepID=A0A1D1VYZ8_RAMVA|nr:hypothetical protein RvY_15244 [Ramazzottius varieornatus]